MISQQFTGSNLVFIVGSPRSGTTWLQQLLGSYSKAKTGPETHLFPWFIGPQLRVWSDELKWAVKAKNPPSNGHGLFAYMREEDFIAIEKQYLLALMQPILANLGQDEFFIEKTPSHALFIPEIKQFFPDCKIIHIIRDARDVVASILARRKLFVANDWLKPGWPPKSSRRAALIWQNHVEAVRKGSKSLGSDQFYELRYEDLKSSPESELVKLGHFLHWDWKRDSIIDAIHRHDPKVARETKSATGLSIGGELQAITGISMIKTEGFARKARVGSWKQELSFKQRLGVWLVARKTMNEVGYPWKYPW